MALDAIPSVNDFGQVEVTFSLSKDLKPPSNVGYASDVYTISPINFQLDRPANLTLPCCGDLSSSAPHSFAPLPNLSLLPEASFGLVNVNTNPNGIWMRLELEKPIELDSKTRTVTFPITALRSYAVVVHGREIQIYWLKLTKPLSVVYY